MTKPLAAVEPPTSARGWVFERIRDLPEKLRRPVAPGSYNAEIDGLRFLAIAIVIVGHYMERAIRFFPAARAEVEANPILTLLVRPGLGVYLFFAISGFIIASQFIKAKASPLSGRFLRAYFGRRILRIEPPYVILLVATWLLIIATGYKPDQTTHFEAVPNSLNLSLAGSIFYLHGLLWGTYPRLFPPGWSLEIEVQFYLLAPLLFWAYFRSTSGSAKVALSALGLLGGAWLSIQTPQSFGPVHTYTSIFRFFQYFWLGIVLADLRGSIVEMTNRVPARLISLVGWLGLVFYLVMPSTTDEHLLSSFGIRLAMLATLAAMFISALSRGSSFRAFCARPWISVIGGACYSIYLTHLQTIQALTAVVAKIAPSSGLGFVLLNLVVETFVVLVVGLIFYALIERTFMIKDWLGRVRHWIKTLTATPHAAVGTPVSARDGDG